MKPTIENAVPGFKNDFSGDVLEENAFYIVSLPYLGQH
jgi:hypothetical protein